MDEGTVLDSTKYFGSLIVWVISREIGWLGKTIEPSHDLPRLRTTIHTLYISVCSLTSETVQGLSLSLQGIDDIHGSDGLSAGVLSVGHTVTNDVLKEHLQDTTSFLVNQTRDTLHTTTTCKTTDGGLRNTLDVITENLSVTLGASLSKTFSSLSSARHLD